MQDFLRDRLTNEEVERYEMYDGLAVIATQFLVWPALLGLMLSATGQTTAARVCWVIAIVALPLMLFLGRRARALLKVAEDRYLALMGAPRWD
ncbi:MAG TPA: hypothetical protein VMX97_12425 [Hyphomicrobiaceae bacterium]|nr:hypothetical protein [Hyphomicrobiaceae bacterium]